MSKAHATFQFANGEYVLAFSTAHRLPHTAAEPHQLRFLRDDSPTMRDLFEMAGEVAQEAALNSLCVAGATDGRTNTIDIFCVPSPVRVDLRITH